MSYTLSFSLHTTPDITVEEVQNFLQANEKNIVPVNHTLTNDAFQVLLFQPECKWTLIISGKCLTELFCYMRSRHMIICHAANYRVTLS